ncbi:hypothetical protein [Micromonospora sp. CB01531]|uniref:hypothetical protein n=1 Tax=Micromonospora sp. CB01531 TaxID=1718947 RepID=UPI00116147B6|nr:hypothetical protein [Micromonospora sp. CB01531]
MALRLERGGQPILVRVEYAALHAGDTVEVAGQQISRDGMPRGQVWLTVDVRALRSAVVGYVELPASRG